jgi:hypothetical protein
MTRNITPAFCERERQLLAKLFSQPNTARHLRSV